MNGQPTSQNTRETGCDGDLSGFRNWQNPKHVEELAELWNVDPLTIPHWGPPTHAMQIFRYAEKGSIGFLWIVGTNPAVSLPDLGRIRSILAKEELFVVVSDAFMTETAELADVVFPSAIWGEKAGTFTNADRTVHFSEQAIEPPGEARADREIFVDFAKRLGLRDKDGDPLLKWRTPEEAYAAWQECSKGRPCNYSELSYDALRAGSGLPWGGERLYADGRFPTDADFAQDYGHDLMTGAAMSRMEFEALGANGRAILKAADYRPRKARPRTTRSCSTPAASSTTSTPAPRPAERRSWRRPLRMSGSSSPRPMPPGSGSRTDSWCVSSRRVARSRGRLGSPATEKVSCSSRSTTATGTRTGPASTRAPRTS